MKNSVTGKIQHSSTYSVKKPYNGSLINVIMLYIEKALLLEWQTDPDQTAPSGFIITDMQ